MPKNFKYNTECKLDTKVSNNNGLVVGYHAVSTLLEHHPEQIKELWLAEEVHIDARQQYLLNKAGLMVQRTSSAWLDRYTNYTHHQGWVAAIFNTITTNDRLLHQIITQNQQNDRQVTLLVLDEVQDPHNLGACMRSANAFKVDAVIVPRNHACGITPVVTKAAAGAVGNTPLITVSNLARCLQELKQYNIWIYGADDQGEAILSPQLFNNSIALVFGSEGGGIRKLVSQQCDQLFKIPMFGQVPCLNVSVAVGIGLYVACQRNT